MSGLIVPDRIAQERRRAEQRRTSIVGSAWRSGREVRTVLGVFEHRGRSYVLVDRVALNGVPSRPFVMKRRAWDGWQGAAEELDVGQ